MDLRAQISGNASLHTEKTGHPGQSNPTTSERVLAVLSDPCTLTTACMEIIHAQQDGTLKELFFGESASTERQTSILDQGPRRPAATQLHQLLGAASPWSGMERTGTGTAHRLLQARCVQRASKKHSAVRSQPQVAPGGHDRHLS
ncbi:hypothetical protein ABVT39_008711 [Epinephelus coioides]